MGTLYPEFNPRTRFASLCAFSILAVPIYLLTPFNYSPIRHSHVVPQNAQAILDTCARLTLAPERPASDGRIISERFEPGSAHPVLLQNATIWTGLKDLDGRVQAVKGELLLVNGIIQGVFGDGLAVGELTRRGYESKGIEIKNVLGAWITPGAQ